MSLKHVRGALFAVVTCLPLAVGCKEDRAATATAPAEAPSPSADASPSSPDASTAQDAQPAESPEPPSPEDAATATTAVPGSSAEKAGEPTEVAAVPAPAETVRSAKPSGPLDISFDDIKFDIKPDAPFKREMLTKKIEDLANKTIRIRGYILPSFQQTGLTQFVLVRDNMACCFGPGAALYDCIVVEMKPGKSTDFNLYPVAVEGTFSIQEFKDPDGKALAIYHLDGDEVR